MLLTTAQQQTLKATIEADPVLSLQPANSDGDFEIARQMNLAAAPDFYIWKSKVTRDEMVNGTSSDGTVFNWTGNGYITRSQGERDAFLAMFDATGALNVSKVNVRNALADIFSGTGNAADNRAHLIAVGRRLSTRVEKLFATGTGTTVSPATTSVVGSLTAQDVAAARVA